MTTPTLYVIDTGERPPKPVAVTKRQARLVLLHAGHLDKIQPMIEAIEDPIQRRVAQIEWDDASDVERSNDLVATLGAGLGLTESELDDLFIAAAAL